MSAGGSGAHSWFPTALPPSVRTITEAQKIGCPHPGHKETGTKESGMKISTSRAWLEPAGPPSLGCPRQGAGSLALWYGFCCGSSNLTAGYSFNMCFSCLSSYWKTRTHGQSGKILTTFGFQKRKGMTKIKHQKKPNLRSSSLENEPEQRYTLKNGIQWVRPPLFFLIFIWTSLFL